MAGEERKRILVRPLENPEVALEELPERFVACSPEGIWFLAAGKMGEQGPGAGCDGPIAKIARDLRFRVDDSDCLTLVDFKAGFEDSARGVLVGLDCAVVVANRVDSGSAAGDVEDLMRALEGQSAVFFWSVRK